MRFDLIKLVSEDVNHIKSCYYHSKRHALGSRMRHYSLIELLSSMMGEA